VANVIHGKSVTSIVNPLEVSQLKNQNKLRQQILKFQYYKKKSQQPESGVLKIELKLVEQPKVSMEAKIKKYFCLKK
jgi:hypothetical protein